MERETEQAPSIGCLGKIFYPLMTGLISYQLVYNLLGSLELGGKYMSAGWLVYAVATLIPGILIGIYASKLAWTSKAEARSALMEKRNFYIVFARIYVGLVLLLLVLLPVSGYIASFFDQLSIQNIQSFRREAYWMVRFFIGIQFTGCFVLSVAFLCRMRNYCAAWSSAKQEEL